MIKMVNQRTLEQLQAGDFFRSYFVCWLPPWTVVVATYMIILLYNKIKTPSCRVAVMIFSY